MQALFQLHDWVVKYASRYKMWLAAFIIILFAANWYAKQDNKQQATQAIINAPALFDVFIVDEGKLNQESTAQSQFKIYQVSHIDNDSVQFRVGRYSYYRYRDIKRGIQLNQLMIDNYYMSTPVTWNSTDLPHLFAQGVIFEAHRPVDIYVLGGIVRHREKA